MVYYEKPNYDNYSADNFLVHIENEIRTNAASSYVEDILDKLIKSKNITPNDKVITVQRLARMKVTQNIKAREMIINMSEWITVAKLIRFAIPSQEEIKNIPEDKGDFEYEKTKESFLKGDFDTFVSSVRPMFISIAEIAKTDKEKAIQLSKTMLDQFTPLKYEMEVEVKDLLLQMECYNEFNEAIKEDKIM